MPRPMGPPTLASYARNRTALARLTNQIVLDFAKPREWRDEAVRLARELTDHLYKVEALESVHLGKT